MVINLRRRVRRASESMSFYQVPDFIFNPIASRDLCKGRVLLPLDPEGRLEQQIRECGVTEFITPSDAEDYMDPMWWKYYEGNFDWTVAITQGIESTQRLDYIIKPGYEFASEGLVVLDRITFLEPTRNRVKFLTDKPLSNLIVLNPRPEFRADQNKSKDSVTSAWYVFGKNNPDKKSRIEFDVNWQRPNVFADL